MYKSGIVYLFLFNAFSFYRIFVMNLFILKLINESLNRKVKNYFAYFNYEQQDLQRVLYLTSDLFQQLVKYFQNQTVLAGLVGRINFVHVKNIIKEVDERSHYF